MTTEELEALLRPFGIFDFKARKLDGYDSENFRVDSDGESFVLKVYRPGSIEKELVKAESELLSQLSGDDSFDTPVPFETQDGEFLVENSDGGFARLLSFVRGTFFGDAEADADLRRSFGEFVARLSAAINENPPFAYRARTSDWDLANYGLNRRFLTFIKNPGDRALVEYFFQQADVRLPHIELRPGMIHGDAHESNVLTKDGSVTGIIDFGDATWSCLVNDVAIAATYLMFEQQDPLAAACEFLRGYCTEGELTADEVSVLYHLIALRACISVCHSAESKYRKPDDEYVTVSEKSAWRLLHSLLEINPLEAERMFRDAAGLAGVEEADVATDLTRRYRTTSKALSVTFDVPLRMESAAFQYMYASDGTAYLDCYNNIPQVGHCHPRVVEAGRRAMSTLNTNTRYLNENYLSYAENLLDLFPAHLTKVFFVNSGSAANDLALRLANAHNGRTDVAVIEHGYHGNTRSGIDISHYKYDRKGGSGRKETITEFAIPDAYKGKFRGPEAGEKYGMEAVSAIPDQGLSAFIAEPVVGCGGQVPLPSGYLKSVYEGVRASGGLCISDEVQTGFGRLGDWYWGFEMHGVEPDIVVVGKPMGNGHPMAAVITTDVIAASFETGMEFFSSFGGNTVSCAIGQSVLDVIEDEGLRENASAVGAFLLNGLKGLVDRHDRAGDARGAGLFLGLELIEGGDPERPATELAGLVKNRLKERGILVGIDGPHENVVKIKPPICFSKENAERLVEELDRSLA